MSSSAAPAPAPVATPKIPPTSLLGDIAIAAPGSTGENQGYVGVWVKDAATCAQIGTPDATYFAVITVSTFRNGPDVYFGNFAGFKDGKITTTVGGTTKHLEVTLEQTAPDTLTVNGVPMIRCSL